MLEAALVGDTEQERKIMKLEREVGYLKEQRAVFKKAFGGAGQQNATKRSPPSAISACRRSKSRMPLAWLAARCNMLLGR